MSAGGFKFAKVTIQDIASNYANADAFCVAIHLARCEAFLRATERENAHWTTIHTGLTGEDELTVHYDDNNTMPIYVVPFYKTSTYPAYVSFFKDTDSSAEYAIMTSAGLSVSSSSTTAAYINPNRLNKLCNGGYNYYHMGMSFNHAMAMNGFSSYDVTSSTVATDEIPFTSQYGTASDIYSTTNNSTASGIYNYSGGAYNSHYFSFGYAVKGDIIESFYQFDNGIPLWSLIGRIFDVSCIGSHPFGTVVCPCMATSDNTTGINNQCWIDNSASLLCVLDYQGNHYPNSTIHNSAYQYLKSRCVASYNGARANTTVPENLYYGALCCSFVVTSGIYNIAGLDADGNLQKGYIDTDVLRVVSHQLCKSPGSIFQSGNFISMGIGVANTDGILGILLGWDTSNSSLM